MFNKEYNFVTVGGATRDFMFYDPQAKFLFTPENLTRQRSLCFEYGSKIEVDKTYFTFGGGAANAAVNLANLGLKVATITSLGFDENGTAILENFRARGVDTRFIQFVAKELTGFSFILTAGREKEHVIFLYRGANKLLKLDHQTLHKLKTKWFYVASLSGAGWREVLEHIYSRRGFKAWNPGGGQLKVGYFGLRRYLERTHVLLLNKDEAISLVISHPDYKNSGSRLNDNKFLLRALRQMGPALVLITNGRSGADAYDGKKFYHQKVLSNIKKAADTTGVGDCFDSTFVAGLEKYRFDIAKSLVAAAKNAASLVTKVGAQNGLIKVL